MKRIVLLDVEADQPDPEGTLAVLSECPSFAQAQAEAWQAIYLHCRALGMSVS